MNAPPRRLEIGRVVKPHGLTGEVVVALVTNRLERMAPGGRLGVAVGSGVSTWAGDELEILASRPHQGRFLVRFAGVTSREQAEALRGTVLEAPAIEDDPEAFFVHELIGAEVFDLEGTSYGLVSAVEANPASDLLVVGEGHYVPLRFVVERSRDRLVVDVPAGLLE